MAGGSYVPQLNLTDAEQLEQERLQAEAWSRAAEAARARSMPPPPEPAGPPPPPPIGPPVPVDFPESGKTYLTADGKPSAAPPPDAAPPEESPPPPPSPPGPPGMSDLPPIRSGGGTVIPGGMQPFTEERDVKYGKETSPVVRQAFGAAAGLEMEGAKLRQEAGQQQVQDEANAATRKMLASDQAALQVQRISEDRDRTVQARMAEIERLNREAQGKPEDLWTSPVLFGRLMGALLLGVGATMAVSGGNMGAATGLAMGGKFIDGLINQDINLKLHERKAAGQQAARQTNLLHLHMQNFDDEKKAVDATKLAYYDSILQSMEKMKAERGGKINEASYLETQADILKMRAKLEDGFVTREQADTTDKLVDKMRPPQVVGGGGPAAGLSQAPNTVTISDGTTWSLGDSPQADKAVERIRAMQKLQEVNQRIKKLRQTAYKLSPVSDHEDYTRVMSELEDLGSQKAPLMSMALDGSTIRKDERDEIEKKNIKATEGLTLPAQAAGAVPVLGQKWQKAQQAAADATLDSQTSLWQKNQKIEASGAGGKQVVEGYVHNEHGEKRPVSRYTGVNAKPDEYLPPDSFRPDDKKRTAPTRGRPLSEQQGQAPDFGLQRTPPPSGGKKKKKT